MAHCLTHAPSIAALLCHRVTVFLATINSGALATAQGTIHLKELPIIGRFVDLLRHTHRFMTVYLHFPDNSAMLAELNFGFAKTNPRFVHIQRQLNLWPRRKQSKSAFVHGRCRHRCPRGALRCDDTKWL